jgi:DNA-3-methyladenine glycosylase II
MTYSRACLIGGTVTRIEVKQVGSPVAQELEIRVEGPPRSPYLEAESTRLVERLLGTQIDLQGFYQMARGDEWLNALAGPFVGLKPPRLGTVFEAVVNGIACQQLSLHVGILLLNRLAEACGPSVGGRGGPHYVFPEPRHVAGLGADRLREIGFSTQKTRALLTLAADAATGRIDLEALEHLDKEEALQALLKIRGVGRWTAEYALLRGLGRLSVFPGDDVGARAKLRTLLHYERLLSFDEVRAIVARWDPYGGFVYFHLLLNGLSEKGYLP